MTETETAIGAAIVIVIVTVTMIATMKRKRKGIRETEGMMMGIVTASVDVKESQKIQRTDA